MNRFLSNRVCRRDRREDVGREPVIQHLPGAEFVFLHREGMTTRDLLRRSNLNFDEDHGTWRFDIASMPRRKIVDVDIDFFHVLPNTDTRKVFCPTGNTSNLEICLSLCLCASFLSLRLRSVVRKDKAQTETAIQAQKHHTGNHVRFVQSFGRIPTSRELRNTELEEIDIDKVRDKLTEILLENFAAATSDEGFPRIESESWCRKNLESVVQLERFLRSFKFERECPLSERRVRKTIINDALNPPPHTVDEDLEMENIISLADAIVRHIQKHFNMENSSVYDSVFTSVQGNMRRCVSVFLSPNEMRRRRTQISADQTRKCSSSHRQSRTRCVSVLPANQMWQPKT